MRALPLLSALRAALRAPHREELPAEEIEQELVRVVEEARACWRGVASNAEAFITYLGARTPPGPVPSALRALHTSDLYLAHACAAGDPVAIATFARVIVADLDARIVPTVADRIEEVRQLVIEKLLVSAAGPPRITSYRGSGPLHAWVRVSAVRIALDLARRLPDQRSLADASLDAALAEQASDPELAHFKATYRAEIKRSIEIAAAQLSVRERNLLRHSLLDGLTIDDLAALYRVHRATAARWLSNARDGLAAATKRDLATRLGLRADDLASLMRVVESQLEVSWSPFGR